MHDEISNEVQNNSESDDLPMTFSSRASFTKNERIIGESTNGQITSEDISFAGKQSSCCLNKEEKGEFSELSKFMRTARVPRLLALSWYDLVMLSVNRSLAEGLEPPPRPLERSLRVSIVTALKTNNWRIYLLLANNTKHASFWMVYCVVSCNILVNGVL